MRPVRLALLLCLFASLSCRGKVQPAAKESPTPVTRAAGPVKLVTGSDVPFLVELSEADPSLDAASGEARAAVAGEPLGKDDAAKLLQRLPKSTREVPLPLVQEVAGELGGCCLGKGPTYKEEGEGRGRVIVDGHRTLCFLLLI